MLSYKVMVQTVAARVLFVILRLVYILPLHLVEGVWCRSCGLKPEPSLDNFPDSSYHHGGGVSGQRKKPPPPDLAGVVG
jgi:hypothetical protein